MLQWIEQPARELDTTKLNLLLSGQNKMAKWWPRIAELYIRILQCPPNRIPNWHLISQGFCNSNHYVERINGEAERPWEQKM